MDVDAGTDECMPERSTFRPARKTGFHNMDDLSPANLNSATCHNRRTPTDPRDECHNHDQTPPATPGSFLTRRAPAHALWRGAPLDRPLTWLT